MYFINTHEILHLHVIIDGMMHNYNAKFQRTLCDPHTGSWSVELHRPKYGSIKRIIGTRSRYCKG